MIIDIIPCLNDNYSYLICDEETNTIAIIDPSEFSTCDKVINQNYKKLDYVLNTHHHFDHIGGNEQLKNKYNAKIFGFSGDKARIPGLDKLLVDNQESETRQLINYLDIDWDLKCLSPQDNSRIVETASNIQVRKQVYQDSSQQWKKYEPFLNGVFDELLLG